jgi:hypothetical protein
MSLATTVSAVSMQQEQRARGSDATATSAGSRQPLFTIKFILVREQPEAKDNPRIDLGDGQAAIQAVPLGGQWQTTLSGGSFGDPNTYVCSGWECRDAH